MSARLNPPGSTSLPGLLAAARSDRTALLTTVARVSLGAAVFFTAFRYRWTLFERPIPPVYTDYTNGLLFLSDIFLLLTLAAWGLHRLLHPQRLARGPLLLSLPLAGLLLAALVSVVFSIAPPVSTYYFIRLLLAAGLYLYLVNEKPGLLQFGGWLAAGVLVQGLVGVTQTLQQSDLGLQRLGEYELDPAWNGVSIVWAQGVRSLRAYGLSDHPNLLGGLLAFSLLLLLGRWLAGPGAEPRAEDPAVHQTASGWEVGQGFYAGAFVIGLAGLFVTFSRAAWLGFGAGLAAAGLLLAYHRQWRMLQGGLGLLLLGGIALGPLVWHNLPLLGVRLGAAGAFETVEYETRSLDERARLNQEANILFANNAVNGVGLGAAPLALFYAHPIFPHHYQPPHLAPLEVAVETGLFGALFYSLALAAPWLALWLGRGRLAFKPGLVAASAALLAVTVVGFFDYYPWLLAPGRFWQWFVWGLWAVEYAAARTPAETPAIDQTTETRRVL